MPIGFDTRLIICLNCVNEFNTFWERNRYLFEAALDIVAATNLIVLTGLQKVHPSGNGATRLTTTISFKVTYRILGGWSGKHMS